MKKVFFSFYVFLLSQYGFSQATPANLKTVSITFYNNSLLSHTFSFISYAPGETGNGTYQVMLKPYAKTEQKYIPGTKLYLADKKQVDMVMSGNKLEKVPFRIISANDDKKTIKLIKNNDDQ